MEPRTKTEGLIPSDSPNADERNAVKEYRIGYTVGDPKGEHETRYFDGSFTYAEAKSQVDEMNRLDAKPGLRGAKLPPSNYFYEIFVANAVRCGICGSAADRFANMFRCQAVAGHVADLTTGIFSDLSYPAMEPIEAVKQSNMLHLKTSASTKSPALCGREDRGTMFYSDGIDDLDALREVEARFKDTDSPLCSNCRERVELSIAFRHAYHWVESRRHADPLSGFGRADDWGPHVLKTFMPEWFQKWIKKSNWHLVGLLQGEEAWWRYVKAFGLSTDEWWRQVHALERLELGAPLP